MAAAAVQTRLAPAGVRPAAAHQSSVLVENIIMLTNEPAQC
jgi:hypothetical protein